MKKKDSLKKMFSDSILNKEIQLNTVGGAVVDTQSYNGTKSHTTGEGGYTNYDQAPLGVDDGYVTY